jgi:hypothetical protein
VGVVYRAIPTPATLTVTLTGPVTFADGSQVFTADITSPIGSHALHVRPAAGATPGATFNLEAALAGLHLERVGIIAWGLYLPLIRRVVLTPTPTPTPTQTPPQPGTADVRMSDAPGGPEKTRFPSGTSVVYVVFDYFDVQNEEFTIRIYDNVGNVLFEHAKTYTGSGTESIEVAGPEGEAFPDGRYLTNLYGGGPIKTILWEVSPATSTSTPVLPTATPTPVPPTATATPVPPTPTLAPNSRH